MEITRRKVVTNVLWGFGEKICAHLVSFIVSIIIARILSPKDYGTIALVLVFLDILQIFVDSGLGNALIQKKDADDLDFSTVFIFNLIFCIVLYICIFYLSPLISHFYNNVELTKIIRVLSVSILISGIKNIQYSYVSKKLIFKKFFFATIIGTIIAAIVGIVMAFRGFGVWALVAQQLTNNAIDTIILWFTVKWRPKFLFSVTRLKKLYSYGWKIFLTALINCIYNKLREMLIGKLYSPEDLAFYNRGYSLSYLIVSNVDGSISNVMLPAMADVQDNLERIRKIMVKLLEVTTYILVPCLIGVAAIAPNLIKVLLTDKWINCVPFLQVFCISFVFYPIYTANLSAFKAVGKSDVYLKMEIVKKIIGFSILMLSVRFGPFIMAITFLIERFLEVFIDSFPSKKLLNFSIIKQLKIVRANYLISIIMGICVYFIGYFVKINLICLVFLQIISGILIYILLSVIFKNNTFNYLMNIVKVKLGWKNNV